MMRLASDGNADDPAYWAALGLPGTIIEAIEIAPVPAMGTRLSSHYSVIDPRVVLPFTMPHSGRALITLTSVFVFEAQAQPIVGWWDIDADLEVGRRRTLGGGNAGNDSLIGATSTIEWVLELEAERAYNLALAGNSANDVDVFLFADDGCELGVGPILIKVVAL